MVDLHSEPHDDVTDVVATWQNYCEYKTTLLQYKFTLQIPANIRPKTKTKNPWTNLFVGHKRKQNSTHNKIDDSYNCSHKDDTIDETGVQNETRKLSRPTVEKAKLKRHNKHTAKIWSVFQYWFTNSLQCITFIVWVWDMFITWEATHVWLYYFVPLQTDCNEHTNSYTM